MKENYNTIVIGGGASGMIAAVTAAEHGESVLLLEKADRLGRKISASGNGRCNMMNTGVTRYFGATEFANEVIRNCSIDDMTLAIYDQAVNIHFDSICKRRILYACKNNV